MPKSASGLRLLWAVPVTPNPLAVTLGVLGYLVAAVVSRCVV